MVAVATNNMKPTNEQIVHNPRENYYIEQLAKWYNSQKARHHIPSDDADGLIESLPRLVSQPPEMRRYRIGYEEYLGLLPVMSYHCNVRSAVSHAVMSSLGKRLIAEPPPWLLDREHNTFERSILAVEEPGNGKEGAEILIAHWPKGFTSPVHGHAGGYLYEQVLNGRLLVNTYRHVGNRVVRPVSTTIHDAPEVLVSSYVEEDNEPRIGFVHSFTALEPTDTIHFLPEHTRDNRDNAVNVEYYDGVSLSNVYVRLNVAQALKSLKVGDVALVRSKRVAELGDHWIVITGGLEKKYLGAHDDVANGYRPADIHWAAPNMSALLDKFEPDGYGMVMLKLNDPTRFYEFHDIKLNNGLTPTAKLPTLPI